MSRKVLYALLVCFGLPAGWTACGNATDAASENTTEHVRERYDDGKRKTLWVYAGTDSLNRTEQSLHPNGKVMTEGNMINGMRHGEWVSYHPDGTLWSRHLYNNGKQGGPYRVYYHTGAPRIMGQYIDGRETGEWIFFTEQGDTARVVNFE